MNYYKLNKKYNNSSPASDSNYVNRGGRSLPAVPVIRKQVDTEEPPILKLSSSTNSLQAGQATLPVQGKFGMQQQDILQKRSSALKPFCPEQIPQRKNTSCLPQVSQLYPASQNSILQFKGPRKYAETFKSEKDQIVTWLKEIGIIGIDLSKDDEISEEENAITGWHHLYPYSHLWENHNHHKLSDHGANLKLGPMKNRLGDPGHEIDISYEKAEPKSEESKSRTDIKPTYTPFGKKLFELLEDPKEGKHDNGPKKDIDISKIKTEDYKNKVFPESVDKEDYWSEWYLSEPVRKLKLSDDKIAKAIEELGDEKIISKTTAIISKLNKMMDSLRYSYATHTPALKDGTLMSFQKEPTVETGIPGSKLNRTGILDEKLVSEKTHTYADLIHVLLVSEKWITRGSQGLAHSLAEQFKDKMKTGNSGLIKKLLKESELNHLQTKVEEEFKTIVFNSIAKLDNKKEETKETFYEAIKKEQIKVGGVKLDQKIIEELVTKHLGELKITTTEEVENEPDEEPESFEPVYSTQKEDKKKLPGLYDSFIRNEYEPTDLDEIANLIIRINGKKRYGEESDGDKWVFTYTGQCVLGAEDLETCLKKVLELKEEVSTSKKNRKPVKRQKSQINQFTDEVIVRINHVSKDYGEYWQEPDFSEKEVTKNHSAEEIAGRIESKLGSKGANYMKHNEAISSKDAHKKYTPGIESALTIPGKGYSHSSLKYPVPKELSESSTWDLDVEKEIDFRNEWYKNEFEEFLTGFIAQAENQQSLTAWVPK